MENFVLSDEQLLINQEKKRFNRIGLAFLAFIVISFVASQIFATIYMAVEAILNGGAVSAAFPGWFMWTITIVSFYICAAPITYLILRTTPAKAPERQRLSARSFFFFVFIAFFLMIVGSFAGNIINAILTLLTGGQQGGDVSDALMGSDVWLSVLYTGILAPILEEIFFRKLLIDRMHGAGDGIIMLISGLLFGLFHGNIEQFFYAALIGALFAYIYLHTGRVLYCILIHGVINFMGGIIPLLVQLIADRAMSSLTDEALKGGIMTLISLLISAPQYLLAIAGLVIFILYFGGLKRQIRPGTLPMKKVSAAAFGNVGMILFLVAAGIQILMSVFL